MPKISRLALIGFGQTAQTLLQVGLNRPSRIITAFDPNVLSKETCKDQLERFIHFGVQGCFSVEDAVHSAHLILVSSHRQDLTPWVSQLANVLQPGQIVADLRGAEADKAPLKALASALEVEYFAGELTLAGEQLQLRSEQSQSLSDIFKSLELAPQHIALVNKP